MYIYSGLPWRSLILFNFYDSLILNLLRVQVTIFFPRVMVFNQQNNKHLLTLVIVLSVCGLLLCDRESVHVSYRLCISVLSRGRGLVLYKHFCTWSHAWNWISNAIFHGRYCVKLFEGWGSCSLCWYWWELLTITV